MKLLLSLCLVICFAGAHCENIATRIKNVNAAKQRLSECIAKSKVDIQMIEDIEKNRVFSNTPEIQSYVACMLEKEGLMNADGTFTEKFLETRYLQGCNNEGGKDTGEIAFKAIVCILKAQPIEGTLNFKF